MTKNKFAKLVDACLDLVKSMSPYKTGNLRRNAIRVEWRGDDEARIYIDEGKAPYAKYTVGHWEHKVIRMGNFRPGEVVERLRTWDNPNEGWWDRAAMAVVDLIAKTTGGTVQK